MIPFGYRLCNFFSRAETWKVTFFYVCMYKHTHTHTHIQKIFTFHVFVLEKTLWLILWWLWDLWSLELNCKSHISRSYKSPQRGWQNSCLSQTEDLYFVSSPQFSFQNLIFLLVHQSSKFFVTSMSSSAKYTLRMNTKEKNKDFYVCTRFINYYI